MNVLDLFSGIGGFSLGLERAGMRTVGFCEIEPFARGVLAKHWPDIPCSHDIETREFTEGEADVICGGFPCQDISLAGAGAGLAGERSGLWRHLLRAIRLVRPRYAIVENVAALLNRGMGTVLGDLAEIGQDTEWHCISARAVGAPHIRDRIWIVAADPARGRHGLDGLGQALERLLDNPGEDLAYANGSRWAARDRNVSPAGYGDSIAASGGDVDVADTIGPRLERLSDFGRNLAEELAPAERARAISDADEERLEGTKFLEIGNNIVERNCYTGWWATEPDVGRVAHGVPSRVDRLKGLGNAVVPQIPEIIGRAIMMAEAERT